MNDGFLKAASLSPSLRVADCAYNTSQILSQLKDAAARGVRLAVFPEFCLTGYTCGDLFLQRTLQQGALDGLQTLLDASRELDVVALVGLPLLVGQAVQLRRRPLRRASSGPRAQDATSPTTPSSTNSASSPRAAPLRWRHATVLVRRRRCPSPAPPTCSSACRRNCPAFVAGRGDLRRPLGAPAHRRPPRSRRGDGAFEPLGQRRPRRQARLPARAGVHRSPRVWRRPMSTPGPGRTSPRRTLSLPGIRSSTSTAASWPSPSRFLRGCSLPTRTWAVRPRAPRQQRLPPSAGRDLRAVSFSQPLRALELRRFIDPAPFIPHDPDHLSERAEELLSIQAHGLARRLRHTHAQKLVLGVSGGLDPTLALLVCVRALKLAGLDASHLTAVTMPCFGTTPPHAHQRRDHVPDELAVSFTEHRHTAKATVHSHMSRTSGRSVAGRSTSPTENATGPRAHPRS